jgi:hypothetical protein
MDAADGPRPDAGGQESTPRASGQHRTGDAPWLGEILSTVAEFGSASLGLVAWELCLPEEALHPAWRQALAEGLIEDAGRDPESDEEMYRVRAPARGRVPTN